jgi:hypothetical protein
MIEAKHCLGFAIDCGTMAKGAGAVAMAFILFIGSVYLVLSAIFGRWMGYLVVMVSFSGWMIIMSSLWLFGFWSQGLQTPTNLGPRGAEPAWVVLDATTGRTSTTYQAFSKYPGSPWKQANQKDKTQAAAVQQASSEAQTFLAQQLNAEKHILLTSPTAYTSLQFSVDDIVFATAEDGKTPLAVATAHFNDGGPLWTVSMYHDSGSVPRYSYMFLGGSILLFALHLPLLDRAEKKRKEFLTGGTAPAWYGPA